MKRYWPFIVFAVFLAAFTLGAYMGDKLGRRIERLRADAEFSSLCAENIDLNQRLAQAELMIATQAKARKPSTQD